MDKSILDKVSVNLSDEELKRIIKLALLADSTNSKLMGSVLPETYNALSSIVSDEDNKDFVGYEELVLDIFRKYVERLMLIDLSTLENEALKRDIELIKNSPSLMNPSSVKDLFFSEEYKKLNFRAVSPQDMYPLSRYVHFRGSYLTNFKMEDVECRFYLSPKMENLAELSRDIINKHNERALPCYFKVNKYPDNNDRVILYSSLQNVEVHIEVLNSIRQEKPHLFEGMNKNPLWGNIEGVSDIYFGMEPSNGGKASYGSLRGGIFDEAIDDLRTIYPNFDIEQDITNEMLEKFKNFLYVHCKLHNVDPNNIVLNGSGEDYKSIALNGKDGKEKPIWVHYFNPNSMEFRISTSPVTSSNELFGEESQTFTPHGAVDVSFDTLELLYKHKQESPDYEKSELMRNRVCKKLEDLEKKQKLKRVFKKFSDNFVPGTRLVQRSFDGRALVGGGQINYDLYKALPYKLSELLGKLQLRMENRKKGIVDIKQTEEIAVLNEDISTFSQEEIEQSISDITLKKEGRKL